MIRKAIILSLTIFATHIGLAQQSGQIGAFDFLPQSVSANPALRPVGRVNIGIPALSQIYFEHGNNWFKPNEYLVTDGNGTATLDAEQILASIDESAYTGQSLGFELLHVGLRFGKHYVHARVAERVQVGITIPKDIFYLGVYGNAGTHKFENNTVNLSGLDVDMIHFREYAVGYNIKYNDKWHFGITAKYLYGMERIQTEHSSLRLRTDPLTYDMQTSGSFVVNTAGVYGAASDEKEGVQEDAKTYLLGLKNTGFGGDLGLVYKPIEKLQIEVSANDIGFIKWRSDVATYGTENAEFAYNGIDLTDFIFTEGSDFNDAFQDKLDTLLDDLENAYQFERTEKEFSTGLNGYMRYGASYELLTSEKFPGKAWASVFHGIGESEVPFSFSVGYNQKLWKVVQAGVHYTKNTNFSGAIGAGLSLNAGPFQIYCLAENLRFSNLTKITVVDQDNPQDESSFVYFTNPQDVRLNVGINLTFGMKKDDAPGGEPMKR